MLAITDVGAASGDHLERAGARRRRPLAQLHRDSHHRCFIANSVRSNITVAGT